MGNSNNDLVTQWAWMMEDVASYTEGGGNAYRDSLDLLLQTALEKDVDPNTLDSETLARVNQAARHVIQNTLDIYALDDQFQIEQELAAVHRGEQ